MSLTIQRGVKLTPLALIERNQVISRAAFCSRACTILYFLKMGACNWTLEFCIRLILPFFVTCPQLEVVM